uniref:DRBM domain-containing protein n=1 Tax=Lutzomyia longipalpis TaxID=7200 RepID=A0A1B0C9S1_LUTLO
CLLPAPWCKRKAQNINTGYDTILNFSLFSVFPRIFLKLKMAQKTPTKTPVTILQEKCVKEKRNVPIYQEIPSGEEKVFTIQVEALDVVAVGSARSKQEAKHLAASNLLALIENDSETYVVPFKKVAETDYVGTLLDICVSRNFPIAQFVQVDACGPSHAPSFTFKCEVAKMQKTATHSTKKGAKQLVAKEMIDLIQQMYPDDKKVLVRVADAMDHEQERTDGLFKSYREWKNSDAKVLPGVKLADRHNFFVNVEPQKYANAIAVLQMNEPDEEKAFLLAKALGFELIVYAGD